MQDRPKVRIYFEGDPSLKRGFAAVLASLREKAAAAKMGWELVAGRGRDQTIQRFKLALETHKDDVIALLVDADGPVGSANPWEHLRIAPNGVSRKPRGAKDGHAHLMVQIMESWFLADRKALETYYGQGFRASCLPRTSDIESVSKEAIVNCLQQAVSGTKKHAYHKTRHAPDILERIDSGRVRRESKWCDRLFTTIENAIEAANQ